MYESNAPSHFPDNPLLAPLSRADFITANMPLVYSAFKRYRSACRAASIPPEDAISEGMIGLIHAYDRFDRADTEFSTFAFPYICGYIQNVFRKSSGPVRIPRRAYPLVMRINRGQLEDAAPEVVAEELDITVKQAEHALYCFRMGRGAALPDADKRGQQDDLSRPYTDAFIARLKPKPQRVIRLLMADHTPTEVGRLTGLSRQPVYNIVARTRANYEAYEKVSA